MNEIDTECPRLSQCAPRFFCDKFRGASPLDQIVSHHVNQSISILSPSPVSSPPGSSRDSSGSAVKRSIAVCVLRWASPLPPASVSPAPWVSRRTTSVAGRGRGTAVQGTRPCAASTAASMSACQVRARTETSLINNPTARSSILHTKISLHQRKSFHRQL